MPRSKKVHSRLRKNSLAKKPKLLSLKKKRTRTLSTLFKRKKKKLTLKTILRGLFHPHKNNKHRAKILHLDSLFSFIIIVVGVFSLLSTFKYFPTLKEGVLGYASNISADQVVSLTNQERAKLGYQPVKMNPLLNQAALAKAQDMFSKQYWAHTSPDGKDPWYFIGQANYSYLLAGENLARDFATTPEMVAAWMASPTHRANIVNARYQEIGIAVVNGVLEGFETTLVVQMFGTPRVKSPTVETQASNNENKAEAVEVAPAKEVLAEKTEEPELEPTQATVKVIAQEPAEEVLAESEEQVLSGAVIPVGSLTRPPLFTPLQITKAVFLSVIMMIVLTLVYDGLVAQHRKTARLVGNNLDHILFLCTVAFLLIFFKGGMIN